jgi:hypothetical protein
MPKPDSIALAALAESEGLEAVLVGGNAVNLHAYFRTTFDIDLLIPENGADRWLEFFQTRGYEIFHRTPNFVRLRFASDPSGALPVDLMLSDEATFREIQEKTRRCEVGKGISLPIPTVFHLIAMKLHALRSPHRIQHGVDLQDVKHLIKTARIDTSSNEFIEVVERYGTEGIRTRIERELREESGA